MERQFFSGNTVEQAVLAAARHYGIEPQRVAYKLRDKKHGFLNIRRRIVIEVDPKAPETDELVEPAVQPASAEREGGTDLGYTPSNSDEPASDSRDLLDTLPAPRGVEEWLGADLPESTGSEADALRTVLGEVTEFVSPRLNFSVKDDEEGYDIEIVGHDSEILRAGQGRGLDAIQHIAPRMVRSLVGQSSPCRVDSEGFRDLREQELRTIALQAAADVQREQEEQVLDPMTPAERRVVHMALADDPTVKTASDGNRYIKQVRIVPVNPG